MTGTAAGKRDDCNADGDEHYDGVDGNEGIKNGLQQWGCQKYAFSEEYPGCKYSHVSKLVLAVIPKVCLPRGRFCHIKDLDINLDSLSEDTVERGENYAQIALLMFYLFRFKNDLKLDVRYYKLFERERSLHFDNKHNKPTTFWYNRFEILQNMQDRMALENNLRRTRSKLTIATNCREPDDSKRQPSDLANQVPDISEFCLFEE